MTRDQKTDKGGEEEEEEEEEDEEDEEDIIMMTTKIKEVKEEVEVEEDI